MLFIFINPRSLASDPTKGGILIFNISILQMQTLRNKRGSGSCIFLLR